MTMPGSTTLPSDLDILKPLSSSTKPAVSRLADGASCSVPRMCSKECPQCDVMPEHLILIMPMLCKAVSSRWASRIAGQQQ